MPAGGGGPEHEARKLIDDALGAAGWMVQDRDQINISASRGVAVREFKMAGGHGYADYLLFVDQEAVGVLEAKPQGHALTGVETQALKYSTGLPKSLDPPYRPLPFAYLSNGTEVMFINFLDPAPRSRGLFTFHRPETLAEWLTLDPLMHWIRWATVREAPPTGGIYADRPSTLRGRLHAMPQVEIPGLWPNKVTAIRNLEESLYHDRPRALIQMATGSGKTLLAITSIYRLIKFGGARRILFLVDRSNLGEQAEKEFSNYRTTDDKRKFTELYNVQRLTSNTIGSSAKVVITTIQRLYSMLRGEPDLDPDLEEGSQFDATGDVLREPVPVAYNPAIPIEYFDVIFVDECHRSIYSLWRQVLEYFDAYLVGLTATPAMHTFGFFNRNLVMEYSHADAVADGVNVDFEVYRIRTRISEEGSRIEAGPQVSVGYRSRQTRQMRWTIPDEDIVYGPNDLDQKVVAVDQIRLIVRTFRDRLFTEIFPGRREVPKTLIFAKDDNHAEDIVRVVREEFGKGNDFCQKITYKTTGARPADLIQDFRNSFNPRVAVTVDMIATGTDIKPIEIVMFMRSVRSRIFFEQMKGRGVRIIDRDELRAVTPDASAKTHFVVVDCVGVTEQKMADTQPLEQKKSVPFKELLEHVAAGGTDADYFSSLASRLARLDRQCGPEEVERIVAASGGVQLADMTHAIVQALDPDRQVQEARKLFDVPEGQDPSEAQIKKTAATMCRKAVEVLATNPRFRSLLVETKRQLEQLIDEVSLDDLKDAGFSEAAKERAKQLVASFERFLEENKDEIDALQFFYSQPFRHRLHYEDIKALADTIKAPPRQWTPEKLWHAYETLNKSRVRGASGQRLLTDVVSLIRYALHQADVLVPYRDLVDERFQAWLAQQENRGRIFTDEQQQWLRMIKDHIATSMEVEVADFDSVPFAQEGGLGKALLVFGSSLEAIVAELTEALVA